MNDHDPARELHRLADTCTPAVAAELRRAARSLPYRAPEVLGYTARVLAADLRELGADPPTISTAARIVASAGEPRDPACTTRPLRLVAVEVEAVPDAALDPRTGEPRIWSEPGFEDAVSP